MKKLFIDDIRNPPAADYEVVRTSEEAIAWLKLNNMPNVISFDHDLGGDDTSIRVIRYMYEAILDGTLIFPEGFCCLIHSANPVGAENLKHDMLFIMRNLVEVRDWSVVLREYPQ